MQILNRKIVFYDYTHMISRSRDTHNPILTTSSPNKKISGGRIVFFFRAAVQRHRCVMTHIRVSFVCQLREHVPVNLRFLVSFRWIGAEVSYENPTVRFEASRTCRRFRKTFSSDSCSDSKVIELSFCRYPARDFLTRTFGVMAWKMFGRKLGKQPRPSAKVVFYRWAFCGV